MKFSLKERSVPCFGEAQEQPEQRTVCDWYKAVLCHRRMRWWSYVYPFQLADEGISIHDKHLLYLHGFSLVLEVNGLGEIIRFLCKWKPLQKSVVLGQVALLPLSCSDSWLTSKFNSSFQ